MAFSTFCRPPSGLVEAWSAIGAKLLAVAAISCIDADSSSVIAAASLTAANLLRGACSHLHGCACYRFGDFGRLRGNGSQLLGRGRNLFGLILHIAYEGQQVFRQRLEPFSELSHLVLRPDAHRTVAKVSVCQKCCLVSDIDLSTSNIRYPPAYRMSGRRKRANEKGRKISR